MTCVNLKPLYYNIKLNLFSILFTLIYFRELHIKIIIVLFVLNHLDKTINTSFTLCNIFCKIYVYYILEAKYQNKSKKSFNSGNFVFFYHFYVQCPATLHFFIMLALCHIITTAAVSKLRRRKRCGLFCTSYDSTLSIILSLNCIVCITVW